MKSKVERVNIAIENMKEGANYHLRDLRIQLDLGKINKTQFLNLSFMLNEINSILSKLLFIKYYEDKTLYEIRSLIISIKDLCDEETYKSIFSELMKANFELCKDDKQRDKDLLIRFKTVFNRLPNLYKQCLTRAEKTNSSVVTKSKNVDNVKTLTQNYLFTKYNFKKIKVDGMSIGEKWQQEIEKYTELIESGEFSDEIREIYSSMRVLIFKFAAAETVIRTLERIRSLCDLPVYNNIKTRVEKIIEKYQTIYNENRMNYNIAKQHLSGSLIDDTLIGVDKINEQSSDENIVKNSNK